VSSRLDRIEAVLEGWCDADWMPTWKDDKFIPQLLALVNVAKAAGPLFTLAAVAHEGDPWYAENEGLDAEKILADAREALAALHKEPA
jgi:hypothetical protein